MNYTIDCCCAIGNGGGGDPILPIQTPSPFQLEIQDTRTYSGNTPPTPLTFDLKTSEPTDIDEFGDLTKTYGYNSTTGIITINRTGTYRATMSFTAQIENELQPSSKLTIYLTEDPLGSINIVGTLLFQPSGEETSATHSFSKIITIDSVPRQFQVFVQLEDPTPTEQVFIAGESFVPKSLSYVNFEYINSKVQTTTDVRAT